MSIQLISKALHRPHTLTSSDICIHWHLLHLIARRILERAARGINTIIHKVKSHSGIEGNDAADALAKEAAQMRPPCSHDATTPAGCSPFTGKWWPVTTVPAPAGAPAGAAPQHRTVANLRGALKDAVRPATKQGYSNKDSIYAQAWQNTTADPNGAHPSASNLMWTSSKVPTAALISALKARYGLLWNMKLAMRYRRPYLRGRTDSNPPSTAACPLCSHDDSVGHILGGCKHPRMQERYIHRHDAAVRLLHQGLQKGALGGCYTVMDAGTMEATLNLAANGKRLPEWMLPDVDPETRQRMRPDLLIIENLSHDASEASIADAVAQKEQHTIHLIEVGYGPDTRWKDTQARKLSQHTQLKAALTQAGWKVEEHIIVLGNAGTVYQGALPTLITLGLTKAQATKLMNKLHVHAILRLWSIVKTRRRLERTSSPRPHTSGPGPPPRSGVG